MVKAYFENIKSKRPDRFNENDPRLDLREVIAEAGDQAHPPAGVRDIKINEKSGHPPPDYLTKSE